MSGRERVTPILSHVMEEANISVMKEANIYSGKCIQRNRRSFCELYSTEKTEEFAFTHINRGKMLPRYRSPALRMKTTRLPKPATAHTGWPTR